MNTAEGDVNFDACVVKICGYMYVYTCVCVCVCVSTVRLTLPPATADFPEAGSLTQPVEPLLFDQLHDLGLNLLSQLPSEKQKMNEHTHIIGLRELSKLCQPHLSRCGKQATACLRCSKIWM